MSAAVKCLLGTFLPSVIIHKANVLPHFVGTCDCFLRGKKKTDMEFVSHRGWAFLRLLIYIAKLPSEKVVSIYFSPRLYIPFSWWQSNYRRVDENKTLQISPAPVCALVCTDCRQGNRRWIPCPRAQGKLIMVESKWYWLMVSSR